MSRALPLALAAAGVWALGSVWYYDCKIKRVCGPQAPTATPAVAAPVVPAPPATAATVMAAAANEAAGKAVSDAAGATSTPPEAPTAAAPVPLPPAAAAPPLPSLEDRNTPTLVLRVNFDARSAALSLPSDVEARLALMRQGIAEGRKVLVLGHSDGLGARSRIAVVSQQRADTLRDWLIAQGIPAAAIASVQSREDREPIASNSRPEGRSLNRRAEALLTPLPQE